MSREVLVADLLCGAGGSSTGCKYALQELGLKMKLVCVNHWGVAIETHKRNHPEARHYVQDIATVRPHQVVPEGYLDLLMASPTCTHHSVARGGKPTSDQQRSDPWHIITWLTELRVYRLIIENVWEFIGWGPVDPLTGRPIPERKGEYFQAWIQVIRSLGFEPEWRKLNAADYGDATTRQRFILMARSDGRRLIWPAATHARRDAAAARMLSDVKPWRPAREIIDWNKKGKSIFNRKKPLAAKTLMRIYAGVDKFNWPEPYLVILRNHMSAQGIDIPVPTIAANGQHIGLAQPVIFNGRKGNKAKGVDAAPIPELDTKGGVWLAEPATPFVLATGSSGAPRCASEPMPTITTGGAGSPDQGCARPMLVEALIIANRSGNPAKPAATSPVPCMTTAPGGGIALIAPYYGSGSGETCNSADEPLPTVTSKGRFGMVVPVTHSKGSNQARNISQPLPTMTTAKGGEFALVLPVTHEGGHDRVLNAKTDPLPTVTGANRGELAFIEGGQQYDILFRMLDEDELAAAMGLEEYEFTGTKTERVKQVGNAVSRRKMQACVRSIMADDAAAFSMAAE